ncbi:MULTISPECIES: VirE2 family protein [Rhizobium]|uniref:VirE2 family protein n=1 Tax=Rhizobium rhododendri TaxID=2506430 RepID=A0ABY8IQY9_9HYPH|nr:MULTISPECIES: VirE2 family protein [Rhizobium]TQX83520.1 single-stranded DNA-binding protein [Rhizobium sp. rho-13.1]TQY06612.1 single-stranded DNA-binding protein [Rhizobium sp. rho-1.1]WFS26157.1 VirE2 family protein [Rhizobium rhododendri]
MPISQNPEDDIEASGRKRFKLGIVKTEDDHEMPDAPSSSSFGNVTDPKVVDANLKFALDAPLPDSGRRDDEYILVNKAAPGKFVGTAKGSLATMPTPGEFDASCRLYRDKAGNYYPAPLAFNKIEVPDGLSNSERWKSRLAIWNREHDAMGITGRKIFYEADKSVALDKNYKIKNPEDRFIQTSNGPREVEKRYQHPFQAGSELPDIMIKTKQNVVHFVNRFSGDKFTGKTFSEFESHIKQALGPETEIKLRSVSGIMHDSNYLEAWEAGKADIRFGQFAGENRAHNRELPLAVVNIGRVNDGKGGMTPDRYISVKFLMESAPGSPWAEALKKGEYWDRVQLLARDGNHYMAPGKVHYADPKYCEKALEQVNLPRSMALQSKSLETQIEENHLKPPVLVSIGPQLHDARTLNEEHGKSITEKHIFVADRNDKGQRTGNYTSLLEYKRQKQRLPDDAAQAISMNENTYSLGATRPEPALRPIRDSRRNLEERPRGSSINSL